MYEEQKSFPLVIFLHGAGDYKSEPGTNEIWGLYNKSATFRDSFILLTPQCPEPYYWCSKSYLWANYTPYWKGSDTNSFEDGRTLECMQKHMTEFFQKVIEDPILRVDRTRVTLIGSSMGGYGASQLLSYDSSLYTRAIFSVAHYHWGTWRKNFYHEVKDIPTLNHGEENAELTKFLDNVTSSKTGLKEIKFLHS